MIRPLSFAACLVAVIEPAAAGPISANDINSSDNSVQIVLTPTRLRQSLADVPGSVTVITADMMQRYGITTVPDALRLVPGMVVDQTDSGNFSINYHGTNPYFPRRMNVLVDGISVYLPLLARINWEQLPVAMEDILRIEVTRGPNSASYGPNSMMATVNIVTKHPKDAFGTTAVGTIGALDTSRATIRHGGTFGESSTYRMTVDFMRNSGIGSAFYMNPERDGIHLKKINFRSITDMGSNETLDIQASAIQGVKEWGLAPPYQATFPDNHSREYYVSGLWRKSFSENHELQIHAYASQHQFDMAWRGCYPAYHLLPELFALWRANRSYVYALFAGQTPHGGTPRDDALLAAALNAVAALGPRALQTICTDTNQNYTEARRSVELQDTYVFSNALRMVSGLGVRQDTASSESLLQGKVSNDSVHAFSNVEYKPSKWLSVNGGGYLEKDQLTGFTFSPRIAANLYASDQDSFRFVLSKGTRSPNIYEQRGDLAFYLRNFSSPVNGATEGYHFISSRSPGNLKRERVFSKEIGYHGNFPRYGLQVDAKIFNDRLSDLISESPTTLDFALTNNNSVHQRGLDLQLNFDPNSKWAAYLTYSYLRSETSTALEGSQYSKHSGAIGVTHFFDNKARGTLAIYGADDFLAGGFVTRKDLTLSKDFILARQSRLTASLSIRHSSASNKYANNIGAIRDTRFGVGTQYYLTLKLDL